MWGKKTFQQKTKLVSDEMLCFQGYQRGWQNKQIWSKLHKTKRSTFIYLLSIKSTFLYVVLYYCFSTRKVAFVWTNYSADQRQKNEMKENAVIDVFKWLVRTCKMYMEPIPLQLQRHTVSLLHLMLLRLTAGLTLQQFLLWVRSSYCLFKAKRLTYKAAWLVQ